MPTLSINKTYLDGDILFAVDLDNICDSIEDFLNGPNLDDTNIQTSVLSAIALTGMILMYGSATPPTGWLVCDGSEVSKTTYAALYNILDTTYNTGGESAGNFRLPDFRRRAPMGPGGTQVSATAPDITVGSAGGEETHILASAEMPSHQHDDSPGHRHTQRKGSTGSSGPQTINHTTPTTSGIPTQVSTVPTTASTGGGGAHNNMQPSLVSCFIIKT